MTQHIPAWLDGELVPVEKLEVHRRGLRHMAVSVFVLCGDELLLQRRAAGKYHSPGLWANSCCSHPAWGEDPADCAPRRLEEEMGLSGLAMEHRGRIEYRAPVGEGMTEHEVVDVFVAQVATPPRPEPNPDEVDAVAWRDLSALQDEVARTPERYAPWLRIYMAKHLELIRGTPEPAGPARRG